MALALAQLFCQIPRFLTLSGFGVFGLFLAATLIFGPWSLAMLHRVGR